jgi:hypothetical protein
MTASIVQQSNGQWQISFDDVTTGQDYQTVVSYASSLSSAEWIEEMPSDDRGVVALDNFGTASFFNGYTVQNGSQVSISGAGAQPMTMITNSGQALATPSALGGDGASFTVTRTSIVAPTPAAARSGRGRWLRTGTGVQGYTPSPHQSSTQPQITRDLFPARFRYLFGRFGINARAVLGSFRNAPNLTRW